MASIHLTVASRLSRGRGTIDPVMCLVGEIRTACVNKETEAAVFRGDVNAYDTLRRERLRSLHKMSVGAKKNFGVSEWKSI